MSNKKEKKGYDKPTKKKAELRQKGIKAVWD